MDVHIYTTRMCNLNCHHCYYDASGPSPDRSGELTVAELQSTISLLCGKYRASVEMEGGEVFLRDDTPELLAALPEQHLGAMTVTTNGTVPLADMVDSLRHLQALRISMEGHKADIHERLRQSDLGEIVARGQALARAGVPIVARCTLSRTNWASLREMVGTFSEWGFDSVQFFEFQAVGRGQGIARGFALGTEEIRQTLETLQELAEENWCPRFRLGLPASRLPIVHEVLGSGQTGRLRATPKLLPRNSLTIDCNGDLGICPWQVGKDARANLRDTDLADFIETAGEQGALLHRCAHCSAIHLHNGSDPHARSLSSAISALPDGRTSDATA